MRRFLEEDEDPELFLLELGFETLLPELPLDDFGLLTLPDFDLVELRGLLAEEFLPDDLLLRRTEDDDDLGELFVRLTEEPLLVLLFVLLGDTPSLERLLVVAVLPTSFELLSRRTRLEDVPLVLRSVFFFVVTTGPGRDDLVTGVSEPVFLCRLLSTYRRGSTVRRFTGVVRAGIYCLP